MLRASLPFPSRNPRAPSRGSGSSSARLVRRGLRPPLPFHGSLHSKVKIAELTLRPNRVAEAFQSRPRCLTAPAYSPVLEALWCQTPSEDVEEEPEPREGAGFPKGRGGAGYFRATGKGSGGGQRWALLPARSPNLAASEPLVSPKPRSLCGAQLAAKTSNMVQKEPLPHSQSERPQTIPGEAALVH